MVFYRSLGGVCMKDWRIIFYEKSNGEIPVVDFLNGLNREMRYKMMQQLDYLEMRGNMPRGDSTKPLGDGIFELRAQNKTDITRILFFFGKNQEIVLSNGFVKKQQRMPMSELELARRNQADYFERTAMVNVRDLYYKNLEVTSSPKWRELYDVLADAELRAAHGLGTGQSAKWRDEKLR